MTPMTNLPMVVKIRQTRNAMRSRLGPLSNPHWQLLSVTVIVLGCLAWTIGKVCGWVSWPMALFVGLSALVIASEGFPIRDFLKGNSKPRRMRIVSVMLSGMICLSPLLILFSGTITGGSDKMAKSQSSAKAPPATHNPERPQGGFCPVTFQCVPYAKIYDTSEGGRSFLFESHYKTVRLRAGFHKFHCQHRDTLLTIPVRIEQARSYVLKVNMRTKKYLFTE